MTPFFLIFNRWLLIFYFVGNFSHARCEALLSTLNPNKQAFCLLKYVFALLNAIISVVHTGVSSLNVGIIIFII